MNENDLIARLSASRAIMDKVDTGNYKKGNIDQSKITEVDLEQLLENSPHQQYVDEYQERPYTPPAIQQQMYRNLNTTKMPKEIVQAMLDNPINVPDNPYYTFEATENLIREINPNANKQKRTLNPPQRLAETKRMSNLSAGLSESEVREIVRDEMENIVFEYFDKRVIKEDIQIKVGNTIFSGTLSPLPGKNKTVVKKR